MTATVPSCDAIASTAMPSRTAIGPVAVNAIAPVACPKGLMRVAFKRIHATRIKFFCACRCPKTAAHFWATRFIGDASVNS